MVASRSGIFPFVSRGAVWTKSDTSKTRTVLNDIKVPWFPLSKMDMDVFATNTLQYGSDLTADHPGFKDLEYRGRREEIADIAKTYLHSHGDIPKVDYTRTEIETWGKVFTTLSSMYPTHSCKEHREIMPILQKECGYSIKNIPQLQDISKFLKSRTGFTIRPVTGLLSSRDFLNGLAFKVFHSTQYIRHHSDPEYTPEPDVCHELLGHVPMFADAGFAAFSQELGLASLGASDKEIENIARIYWFTVEFGLCKEGSNGEIRAYGAGLLASIAELKYCLTDKPIKKDFDPVLATHQSYPITDYQPLYLVADSIKRAQQQIR